MKLPVPVNRRWLIRGLLGVLLVGVVGFGAFAVFGKRAPEDPMTVAQKEFTQGEEAFKASDLDGARRAYESADTHVRPVLEKEPTQPQALMLRYRILVRLSALAAQEEAKQGNTASDRPSEKYRQEASTVLTQALQDQDNLDAYTVVLNNCFANDDLEHAVPFAQRVAEAGDPKELKDYVVAAHYVMAWHALQAKPPHPQEALEHLELSRQLESPQRWRALGLLAQALALKAAEERRAPGLQHAPKAGSAGVQLVDVLRDGVERANRELETLPKTVGSSPTNVRGLLDLLVLSVENAPDARQAMERAELTVTVCEKLLTIDKPREGLLVEVGRRAARLPAARDALPAGRRPNAEEWQRLAPRIEQVTHHVVDAASTADPALCLEMARSARRDGQLGATERSARQGMERAAAAKLPADNPTLLALRAELAWVFAFRGKPEDREELGQQLEVLRKYPGSFSDTRAELIEGLLALAEGRLGMAIHRLERAQKGLPAAQAFGPTLALAYADMATGAYEHALPQLEKVQQLAGDFQQLSEADKALAEQLLPGRPALLLELFRCRLALGQLDPALAAYRELLPYKAERVTAAVQLINHDVAQGWSDGAAGHRDAAAEDFAAAHKELSAARQLAAGDVRLAWAEANLVLQERGASEKASVADVLLEAEETLRTFAARPGNETQGALALARWYLYRRQLDRAAEQLTRLEKTGAGSARDQVLILRSQLALARSPLVDAEEVERLAGLFGDGESWTDDPALLGSTAALSPYERHALRLYAQALRDQAGGDFQKASKTFELALVYARIKAPVRRGLLGSLVGLINTRLAHDAEMLATGWLKTWDSDEPVLLLAAARAAGAQDSLDGMEKHLKKLEETVGKNKSGVALGAYLSAVEWRRIGREDKARAELDRALKSAAFVPALRLAAELDVAEGDWEALRRHARSLVALQPGMPEAGLWLATAWDKLGNASEARQLCLDLVQRFPGESAGYQGLVAVLERAGDHAGALQWAQRWHEHVAEDTQSLRALVRQLALSNKDAEAAAADGMKGRTEERAVESALAVAQGYTDARAYGRARTWAERAFDLATKLAEGPRKSAVLAARLVLGDVLAKLGETNEAIRVFKEVRQTDPDNFLASRNLAWLLSQKADQAESAYGILDQLLRKNAAGQRAVTGERLPLDFLHVLAEVYLKARHYAEVVPILEEALERYPNDPRLHLHLGRGYAGRGQAPQGKQQFEAASSLALKLARRAADDADRTSWEAVAEEARQEMRGGK